MPCQICVEKILSGIAGVCEVLTLKADGPRTRCSQFLLVIHVCLASLTKITFRIIHSFVYPDSVKHAPSEIIIQLLIQ